MQISAKTIYGTRLMFELALNQQKGFMRLGELARSQGIPEKYAEQIITILKSGGLVISQRGAEGGYSLAKQASLITMKEIFGLLEGSYSLMSKEDDADKSGNNYFLKRKIWDELTESLFDKLKNITLDTLMAGYILENSGLNYDI